MRKYLLLLPFVLLSGCMGKEKSSSEKEVGSNSEDVVNCNVADSISCNVTDSCNVENNIPDAISWKLDVTRSYPHKNITLQSVAKVEYIPIETNDSMLWRAGDMKYVREDMIIAANNSSGIMIYDGKGNAKYSFNKRGSGPNEYGSIDGLCYDKTANELYILDMLGCRVTVYDVEGNFKRSILLKYSGKNRVYSIRNLNQNELLAYVAHDIYARLSKKDGRVIEEKRFCKDKELSLMIRDGKYRANANANPIIMGNDKYIISAYASDVTYMLDKQGKWEAFGMRTPAVLEMEPPVFLFPGVDTPRLYFAYSIKKVWDFKQNEGFPQTGYAIDKKKKSIYEFNYMTNDDFDGLELDITHYNEVDTEYGTAVQILKSSQLIEAKEKNKLRGKLKELAANRQEEDNPVLLVVKFYK